MSIETKNIFHDGKLFLWDEIDYREALINVEPDTVRSLRVGAKCYSCVGLEKLISELAIYKNVTEIEVADDRIQDEDMAHTRSLFLESFPLATFKWSYDSLAGGKHGR
ncbi:hypothetical protein [Microbulbifer sp. ALW1]|uniref:hypothetical protein n=1 Tax=Microbulbifer sp. (strain ALW1) TaxID=1516059 RepID=UPI00135B3DF7|nr:hypothetical protein [Microbulbifer sp. ALW1]